MTWVDDVISKLVPPVPQGPDPINLSIHNTFRELNGLPPHTWAEYVEEWVATDPEKMARLLDEARARVALEEAFLKQRPSSDWI